MVYGYQFEHIFYALDNKLRTAARLINSILQDEEQMWYITKLNGFVWFLVMARTVEFLLHLIARLRIVSREFCLT